MSVKPMNVESMLRSAFLKAELEFLKSQSSFMDALPLVKTPTEFEQLCTLAETLLGEHQRALAAGKQFRSGVRLNTPSR